jgi:hypothetical protein
LYEIQPELFVRSNEATLTFAANGIQPDNLYRISVAAFNDIGEAELSDTITVRTHEEYEVPSEPLDVEEFDQSGSTVTIEFSEPDSDGGDDISSYTVYVSKEIDGEFEEIDVIDSTKTRVDISDLELQSTYGFEVTASNSVGEGDRSDRLVVNTQRAVPPQAPASVDVEIVADKVKVSWGQTPNDGGAAVLRYEVTIDDESTVNCAPGLLRSCEFNVATLKSDPWNMGQGEMFFVAVSAINSEGTSDPAITSGAMPEAPDNISEAPTISDFNTDSVVISLFRGGSDGGNALK